MKRRRFLQGLSGVVLGGLFRWSFPDFSNPLIWAVAGERRPRTLLWAGVDNDWTNPSNWIPNGAPPTDGDSIIIKDGSLCLPLEALKLDRVVILPPADVTLEGGAEAGAEAGRITELELTHGL